MSENERISATEATKALHESLDKQVKEGLEKAGIKPSCGKGCAHCCRLLCTATFAEGLLIAESLILGGQWKEWLPKLREAALKADYPGVEHVSYFKKKIPCVFLKDEACSIYDIRPSACRYHLVVNPPEHCSTDSEGQVQIVDLQKVEYMVWGLSRDLLEENFGGNLGLLGGPLALEVMACARILLQDQPEQLAEVKAACQGLRPPSMWMAEQLKQKEGKVTIP
jgi:Fe-S-cluster containining protein